MMRFIKVCVQVHGQLAYPFVVMEGNGSFILHHVYYSRDKFYDFVTMSNFYYFVTMYNVIIALPSFGLQDKFVHGMKLLEL